MAQCVLEGEEGEKAEREQKKQHVTTLVSN